MLYARHTCPAPQRNSALVGAGLSVVTCAQSSDQEDEGGIGLALAGGCSLSMLNRFTIVSIATVNSRDTRIELCLYISRRACLVLDECEL